MIIIFYAQLRNNYDVIHAQLHRTEVPTSYQKTYVILTHFCPPLRFRNQFLPTVPIFAVRKTDASRTANVGTWLRKRNGGQK